MDSALSQNPSLACSPPSQDCEPPAPPFEIPHAHGGGLDAFNVMVRYFTECGVACDLEVHRDAYERVVLRLRRELAYVGEYARPVRSRLRSPFEQRDFPAIVRDKLTPGRIASKAEFARLACKRPSPFAEADEEMTRQLPPDLAAAIERVARRGSRIVHDRAERMALLRVLAGKLAPLRSALDSVKSACAQLISPDFNVALASAAIDAMRWPNVALPLRFIIGFEIVGDIPDTGVFKADESPASLSEVEFKSQGARKASLLEDEVTRAAVRAIARGEDRPRECWSKTKSEIKKKLVFGPYSRSAVDRMFGRGRHRPIGRTAIFQKGKWRCIDNAKRSKHNSAQHLHESLVCGRADFPPLIARQFDRLCCRDISAKSVRARRRLRMRHGTGDFRAAYRRVPVRTPRFGVVCVYNTDAKEPVYCALPGHNFGLASAVLNCNGPWEMFTAFARRILWIVTEHFYDDSDVSEPDFAGSSGLDALIWLCGNEMLGFEFDDEQTSPMAICNEYLGVMSDFARSAEGIVQMSISEARREKLVALINDTVMSRALPSGTAASIGGKSQWTLSPCFGRVGVASLYSVRARQYANSAKALTPQLEDSLEFIRFLCQVLPPVSLLLQPDVRHATVVFVDASGWKRSKQGAPPGGKLGFTAFHPAEGAVHGYADVPAWLVALFERCKKRDTLIGLFEMLASVAALSSTPKHWLEGRPVELWTDSTHALGSFLKGYSAAEDAARIVNVFWLKVLSLQITSIWLDYVNTESNIADIPSRVGLDEEDDDPLDTELCWEMMGSYVPLALPRFADDAGEWLPSVSVAKEALSMRL